MRLRKIKLWKYRKFWKIFDIEIFFLYFWKQTSHENDNATKISFLSLMSLEIQPPSVTPLNLIFIGIMALGFICANAPINKPYFNQSQKCAPGHILNIWNLFLPQFFRFFDNMLCTLEIKDKNMYEVRELPKTVFS